MGCAESLEVREFPSNHSPPGGGRGATATVTARQTTFFTATPPEGTGDLSAVHFSVASGDSCSLADIQNFVSREWKLVEPSTLAFSVDDSRVLGGTKSGGGPGRRGAGEAGSETSTGDKERQRAGGEHGRGGPVEEESPRDVRDRPSESGSVDLDLDVLAQLLTLGSASEHDVVELKASQKAPRAVAGEDAERTEGSDEMARMNICVRSSTIGSAPWVASVSANDSMEALTARIAQRECVPADCVELSVNDMMLLTANSTLRDMGILPGTVITWKLSRRQPRETSKKLKSRKERKKKEKAGDSGKETRDEAAQEPGRTVQESEGRTEEDIAETRF